MFPVFALYMAGMYAARLDPKVVKSLRGLSGSLLLLAGCASNMTATPPPQPTPESIQSVNVRLSAITTDAITTWQVGSYLVRSACHSYLNAMAARSADINLASSGLGLAGPAAAGFLISGGNPAAAAAAGALSALSQTFLNLFNSSGSIPYTTETASIIEQALNAYENGVNMGPPESVAQAISYVDDLWWQCSAGGYAMLVSKAISSASVGVQMNGMFSFRSLAPTGRPVVVVNPPPPPPPPALPQAFIEPLQPIPDQQPHRVRPRMGVRAPEPPLYHGSPTSDPDKPARLQWLRETSVYIPALDGPR
jgi:hypothetical protein